MSAIAEKLKSAGFRRDDIYLGAVEALRRTNGDVERAVQLLRIAVVSAARDMKSGRNPGAGQDGSENHGCDARDTSEKDGGQVTTEARSIVAPIPLRSVRSVDRTARTAAAHIANQVTLTVFDTFRVRNVPIGNLSYNEATKMEVLNSKEARVLRSIRLHTRPVDRSMKVRDLINESTLKLFIEQAERSNED